MPTEDDLTPLTDPAAIESLNKVVLRVWIDGYWNADEFAAFIKAMDEINNLLFLLNVEYEDLAQREDAFINLHRLSILPRYMRSPMNTDWLGMMIDQLRNSTNRIPLASEDQARLVRTYSPHAILGIEQIQFSSPGFIDFIGIGKVAKQIRLFLQGLIQIWSHRHQRVNDSERQMHENRTLELKNFSMEIENANKVVDLARNLGYSEEEVREFAYSVLRKQTKMAPMLGRGSIKEAGLFLPRPKK